MAPSILEAPLSIVTGPTGSYVAEALAAVIEASGGWHNCVWFRADDRHGEAVPGSLATACRHRWTANTNGHRTALQPSTDDVPLHDVIRQAPERSVIVLEVDHRITPALGRVLRDLRPLVAERGVRLVAVSEHRVGADLAREADQVLPAARVTQTVGNGTGPDDRLLPSACLAKLSRVSRARPAIAHDIVDAADLWPTEAFVDALAGGWSWRFLADRVTRGLLERAGPGHLEALEICVATGYWHPQLATDGLPASDLRPWVVPLEQQWGWLRPVWRRSLGRQLRARAHGRRREPPVAPRRARTAVLDTPAAISLDVRMLGTFEMRVDGIVVGMSSGRGVAVLRFLLSRPGHAASRDELLEEFWPDVAPSTARNRLQVAVSGVRRAFRQVTTAPMLEYHNGSYRISPQVQLQVDTESFEEALRSARAFERNQDPANAMASYRRALSLYRGDFASDAPYEQWTLIPRETLRLRYVDALDRVCRMQLSAGRIDECIATAHRMLDVDPCREDAHRLLMRCYAGQGRAHQALRQFDLCRRVLDTTLEVAPSAETVGLREAIRHSAVLPA